MENPQKRIQRLRTIYDNTQAKLAEMLHISREQVSRIEAGKRTISPKIATKIASTYGVSYDWLFTGVTKDKEDILMFSDHRRGVSTLRDKGLKTTDELDFLLNLCHTAWSLGKAENMDTRSQHVSDLLDAIDSLIDGTNIPELTSIWGDQSTPKDLPTTLNKVRSVIGQSAAVPCTLAAATVSALIEIIRDKLVPVTDTDAMRIAKHYRWIYDVAMAAAVKRKTPLSSVDLPLGRVRALNTGDPYKIIFQNEFVHIQGERLQSGVFSGLLYVKNKATLRIDVLDLVEMLSDKHIFRDDSSDIVTIDHDRASIYLTHAEYQAWLKLSAQIMASETYGSLLWLYVRECGYL